MNRSSSRLGLYAGCVLMFGACITLFLKDRANESRHAASIRDRAAQHAENQWSRRDRAELHAQADALRAEVARFVAQSARRHDETQALLREAIDRLKRIEPRPGIEPEGKPSP